jgi:hypothetical protein
MSSAEAFFPVGVNNGSGNPPFEPVETPYEGVAGREDGVAGPSEKGIKRKLEEEEGEDAQRPTDQELEILRRQKQNGGGPAPNLRSRVSGALGGRLPAIPVQEEVAGILDHDAARNALRKLQSTRGTLEEQLDQLERYLSEGGIVQRLEDRARLMEVRSSDPVWLVVEVCLDSAFRITSGLKIFAESLGVYLEYEFSKVQLYDAVLTHLEGALNENQALRGELASVRSLLSGVQTQLLNLEGNQYAAVNGLPDFARKVSAQFSKALESGQRLTEKTEAASKRLSELGAWLKAAVVVGALAVVGWGVLGWLLVFRGA